MKNPGIFDPLDVLSHIILCSFSFVGGGGWKSRVLTVSPIFFRCGATRLMAQHNAAMQ
jgi:hypothetical protein